VLAKTDAKTGGPLVDVIVNQAEQKGTGTWTAVDALGLGIPLTGITEAVFARGLSALRDQRKKASTTLAGPAPGQGADRDDLIEDIRLALYASKVVAYAQGFAQMRAASDANDWTSTSVPWRRSGGAGASSGPGSSTASGTPTPSTATSRTC
jgi:6-phosphogluconate dehydrogenase